MINRRSFVAASAAALMLAACNSGAEGKTLRVGSQKGGTKSLMLSAGVLDGAPYAVEWAEFPAAQNLLEALGSNAIDVGLVGDAPFQFAYQNGGPIQAVAAQRSQTRAAGVLGIVVAKGSPVRGLEDLRGKTIATGRGSIGHYLILRALQEAGWPVDAVRIVFLSPSDASAALTAGSVAAWSTWSPYIPLVLAQGGRVVVEGNDYVRGYGFEAANVAALENKRDILTDFLAREVKAFAWAAGNVDAYGKVMAQETGLPLPIARWVAQNGRRDPVPIDAALIQSQRQVLDTFAHAGAIEPKRPLSQAFVPGLVKLPA